MTSLKYDCAQSAVRSVVLNLRVRVSGKHVVCAAAVTDAGGKRPVAGAERHDFVQNKPVTHVGKTEQYITDIIRIIAQIVRPGRIAVIALVRADIELAAVLLGRAQNRAHVRRRHAERHGAKLRLQKRLLQSSIHICRLAVSGRVSPGGAGLPVFGGRLFGGGLLCFGGSLFCGCFFGHLRRFGLRFRGGGCTVQHHACRLGRGVCRFCPKKRQTARKADHQHAASSKRRPLDPCGFDYLPLDRRVGTLDQVVSHKADGAEYFFLLFAVCHTVMPSFCKNARSCSRVRKSTDLTVFSFIE